MNRALVLWFKYGQYDALDDISSSISIKTDPKILILWGKQFIQSERWSKTAQRFALAKQFDAVTELCNKPNVKLSHNGIQEISEEPTSDPGDLKRFAALCEQQRDFVTASKLYHKLKDHLSSMNVLIRAGETNKVIKFAKIFKKREAYILAANYI